MTNRLGNSLRGEFVIGEMLLTAKSGGNVDPVLTRAMFKQRGGYDEGGSVTLLRPDGSQYPGSPFSSGMV